MAACDLRDLAAGRATAGRAGRLADAAGGRRVAGCGRRAGGGRAAADAGRRARSGWSSASRAWRDEVDWMVAPAWRAMASGRRVVADDRHRRRRGVVVAVVDRFSRRHAGQRLAQRRVAVIDAAAASCCRIAVVQAHAGNGLVRVQWPGRAGRPPAAAGDGWPPAARHAPPGAWPNSAASSSCSRPPAGGELGRDDVWGPPGDGIAVMRALKERFDPAGILNPGRFVYWMNP